MLLFIHQVIVTHIGIVTSSYGSSALVDGLVLGVAINGILVVSANKHGLGLRGIGS